MAVRHGKLPSDVAWFQSHSVAAHPGQVDLSPIIASAKEALEEDRERAFAGVSDEKKAKGLKAMFEAEAVRLDEFVKDKLKPLFCDNRWKGSVVFIYENSHEDCISLNVRQFRRGEGQAEGVLSPPAHGGQTRRIFPAHLLGKLLG